VVSKVKPSVVAINTEVITYDFFNRPVTQEGAGSGWVLDDEGHIVTNNHVIEGAKNITATLDDGRAFPVRVVGTDALTDLAVLRADAESLVSANIGDSSQARVGEWVLAVGNPLGLGITAKQGIISRLGVSIPLSSVQTLDNLIETSAAINPGNSGGPLVNMRGEVIGITSVKIATVGVEGLGYAISIETALPVIEQLVQQGYVVRPWLGVVVRDVNQWLILTEHLGVDVGAFVVQVADGSPAADAGIKPGDVIVSLGGEEVTGIKRLLEVIHSRQIGAPLEVVFWRGDTRKTAQATMVESPPP